MPEENSSGNLQKDLTPAVGKIRPRVSVALALCDGAKFLHGQLDSLFRQKLIPDEIVVSDDASTDESAAIVREYSDAHPGVIKYIRNDSRLGAAKNFEKAIAATTGDIIFLSDQDDVWHPDKIELMTGKLASALWHPAGVFCNSLLTGESLQILPCTHWDLREFSDVENFTGIRQLEQCCRIAPVAGHNIAFEKELKELLLPFPDLAGCHDNWIALVIAALGNWQIEPATLTLFRQHGGNLSQMLSGQNPWRQAQIALKEHRDQWNSLLYAALVERMGQFPNRFPLEARLLASERKAYSEARSRLSRRFIERIAPVFRLWSSGLYGKFGRGWKNFIQDLFLRSFFG